MGSLTQPVPTVWFAFFLLKHGGSSDMYCSAISFFMVARMFVSTVILFPLVTFWCALFSQMCQQYNKVF